MPAGRIDQQAVEGDDADIFRLRPEFRVGRLLDQRQALLEGKQRLLAGVNADRHEDRVRDRQGAAQHVEVAVGQGIERPRINGNSFAHQRLLASCAPKGNSVFVPPAENARFHVSANMNAR